MLEHFNACPAERTETYAWEGATVSRCLDCGAQRVEELPPLPPDDGVRFEPAPQPAYREVHIY